MIPALVSLKSLIKNKSYHIDYPLFRLHYQVTTCALLAFCLILTAKILFGDTIDCKSRILKRDDFYDNLCYSQGTYTMFAVDNDDLRRTVKTATESQLARDQLSVISESLTNMAPRQVRSSAEEPQSLLQQGAKFAYTILFNDDPLEPAQSGETSIPRNATGVYVNATHRGVFPSEALAGSNVGEFFKRQFRSIHKLIKSNNLHFSPSIRYLYPGIIIPKENAEVYTTIYWHRYYQYIPIILFLQAVFFYLPHYLWKIWENGIISSICKQLHENRFSPVEFIESNCHMIDYLQNCFTMNKSLVYKYYLCHVLLLFNLVTQIVVLNAIFNNQFVTYGIDVFQYLFIDNDVYGLRGVSGSINDLNNPMDYVFPKVTACSMLTLSQAGKRPDTDQFLCVLPLNILHDKFFLILWCWFLILIIITVCQILFDSLFTSLPMLRRYLFERRYGPYLSKDGEHSSLPELFILDLIGSNSDKFAFAALLRKLNKDDWQLSPSENQSLV